MGADRSISIAASPLRIVIVEDQPLLSEVLENALRDLGEIPVGPFSTIPAALGAISSVECDAALLDIRLKDGLVFPVCDRLVELGKPFVFLTGSTEVEIPSRFGYVLRLQKPYGPTDLQKVVAGLRLVWRWRHFSAAH